MVIVSRFFFNFQFIAYIIKKGFIRHIIQYFHPKANAPEHGEPPIPPSHPFISRISLENTVPLLDQNGM
jgi:hypothetical protein